LVFAGIMFFMAGCGDDPEKEHTHDWGAWQVTTAATCTEEGVETRTCKTDGTSETRVIAVDLANGHQWGEWIGTVTCTEGGTGTRTCKLNAAHIEENPNMPPLGHDYKWTQTTAPTYEETSTSLPTPLTVGEETQICSHNPDHKGQTRPTYCIIPYRVESEYGSVTVSTPQTTSATSASKETEITITATPNENGIVVYITVSIWDGQYWGDLIYLYNEQPGAGNTSITYTMPDNHIRFMVGLTKWRPAVSGTINVTVTGNDPYAVIVEATDIATGEMWKRITIDEGVTTWLVGYNEDDRRTLKFNVSAWEVDQYGPYMGIAPEEESDVTVTLTGKDIQNINLGTFNFERFIPFVLVVFRENGGMPPMDPNNPVPGYRPTNVNVGDLIPEPVQPSKPGFTFGGWWNEDFTKQWNFQTDRVPDDGIYENIFLYAKWN